MKKNMAIHVLSLTECSQYMSLVQEDPNTQNSIPSYKYHDSKPRHMHWQSLRYL